MSDLTQVATIYLRACIEAIDEECGEGFAASHLELLIALCTKLCAQDIRDVLVMLTKVVERHETSKTV